MDASQPRWPRRRFLRIATLGAGAALTAGTATTMAADSPRFPISDHCDGRRFFNPRGTFQRSFLRLLRWKLAGSATRWPDRIDVAPQPPPPAPPQGRIAATWINHATFLIRTRHLSILTDPVWGERAGPGSFGPRRAHVPAVRFADLPKIDVVLLSHDHYDHCDVATLQRLAERDSPKVIAPLGHRSLLIEAKVPAEKIIELDWWQSHTIADSTAGSPSSITLTPARHWSNRLTGPANGRLWGGFYLRAEGNSAWFAGDTAYDERFFHEIREKLGAPHLAMIPIGAYEPRWFMAPVHCNPDEAVQIHCDVGAKHSVGMHWGTFQLTDEGRDAPPAALAQALRARSLPAEQFSVVAPGESIVV